MNTYILLAEVDSDTHNIRKKCEEIESFKINSTNELNIPALKFLLEKEFDIKFDYSIMPISDFMDSINNEEFNPDNYFMSYFFVSKISENG